MMANEAGEDPEQGGWGTNAKERELQPEHEQSLYAGDTGDLKAAFKLSLASPGTHQMSWAARELERYLLHSTAAADGGLKGRRVLELKSGQGWLAQRLRAHGALVVATELGDMVDTLRQNLQANSSCGEQGLQVVELDWLQEQTSHSSLKQLTESVGGWDFIVGADCLYLPELFRPLLRVIAVAIENSPKTPRVVLATEHSIVDGDRVAAEFYGECTDGAETTVGGADGYPTASTGHLIAYSDVTKLSGSVKSQVRERTVLSAAGFHGAAKKWESCNDRGGRVACYELQMLPRLRSKAIQITSGPSSLKGNRLLWRMTPGLPDAITPSSWTGTDAVFTTETLPGYLSGASSSNSITDNIHSGSVGGSILLLHNPDKEVPVPIGVTSSLFEVVQPSTDLSMWAAGRGLSSVESVVVCISTPRPDADVDTDEVLPSWQTSDKSTRELDACEGIPGLLCQVRLKSVATNAVGFCFFWDNEESMLVSKGLLDTAVDFLMQFGSVFLFVLIPWTS